MCHRKCAQYGFEGWLEISAQHPKRIWYTHKVLQLWSQCTNKSQKTTCKRHALPGRKPKNLGVFGKEKNSIQESYIPIADQQTKPLLPPMQWFGWNLGDRRLQRSVAEVWSSLPKLNWGWPCRWKAQTLMAKDQLLWDFKDQFPSLSKAKPRPKTACASQLFSLENGWQVKHQQTAGLPLQPWSFDHGAVHALQREHLLFCRFRTPVLEGKVWKVRAKWRENMGKRQKKGIQKRISPVSMALSEPLTGQKAPWGTEDERFVNIDRAFVVSQA